MSRFIAFVALLASCMLASAALPERMSGRDLKNGKKHHGSSSSYAPMKYEYERYCVLNATSAPQMPVDSNTDNLYDCEDTDTSVANAIGYTTFICGPNISMTDRLICERVFVIGDTRAIYVTYVRREANANRIEFPFIKSVGDMEHKKYVDLERDVGVAAGVPPTYFARWVLKYSM